MKKSLQPLLLLVIVLMTVSCSREMVKPQQDISTDVVVKDKIGNNLLSTASANAYNAGEIHLYTLINGTRSEVINGSTQYYQVMSDDQGQPILRFTPVVAKDAKTVTTIIQWRANDEDTIESTIEQSHNGSNCNKVKCNGQVKYEKGNATARRVVEIIK